MRLALFAALVAGVSACTSVNRCTSGTVLVDVTLSGGAENADQLLLAISVDGGSAHTATLAHTAGSQHGSVEIDFPGGYPAGKSAGVTVTALAGGATVGAGMISFALDADCSSESVQIAGAPADLSTSGTDLVMTANDLTMTPVDLAGADFSTVPMDLAVPADLSTPHDLATTPPDFTGIPVDLESPLDFGPPCSTSGPCSFAGSVTDFDVAGDGSVFMASVSGSTLSGRCYAPDGSLRSPGFTVFDNGLTISYMKVSTARTKGTTIVSWIVADPTDAAPSQKQLMSRLFDNTCAPVGAAFAWPGGPSTNYVFDAAIDAQGNPVLLWTSSDGLSTYLSFYNSTGVKTSADVLVNPSATPSVGDGMCGGSYGMHVALSANPSSFVGGVVTCQQHEDSPVRYRRFSPSSAFLDPGMVTITESSVNHSSWYESHQVGVADDGTFVVEWEDATDRSYRANFYNASGVLQKSVTLGPTGPQYYDGFRGAHATVELTSGNFVLRDGFGGKQFWIYSTGGGVLGGCDQAPTTALRTGGSTQNYILKSPGVVRGALDFTRYNLCAPATCGDGVLQASEQCDDGNLEPYDGCSEFCKSEICGDSVVQASEQCDDGPTGSSLCDATCHFKAQTAPTGSKITSADDFDVANDGTLITTQVDSSSGILYATCYAPDHTLIRERFPIAPVEWSASYPTVAISRVAKKSLVGWQSGRSIGVKLLDASCVMVAPHAIASSTANEFYDTAIDDTGRSVVIAADGNASTASVAWYSATFKPLGTPATITSSAAIYGTHAAMNQTNGGGVVSFQNYSGSSVVFYQRFTAAGTFVEAAPVSVPATVQWYDDHTVGMSDSGAFVIESRDASGNMNAVFYDNTGAEKTSTTFSSRVRASEGSQYYDSFRRRLAPIPLKSGNFELGETYNWIVSTAADKTQVWFLYKVDGTGPVSTYTSGVSVDSGLNARLDGNGVSYFWQSGTIYFGASEL